MKDLESIDKLHIKVIKFINEFVEEKETFDDAYEELIKFLRYLESYDYFLSFDLLVTIISENLVIYNLLDVITKTYSDDIELDDMLLCMLDIYRLVRENQGLYSNNKYEAYLKKYLKNKTSLNTLTIYYKDVSEYDVLSKKDERMLFEKLENGDESVKEKIILHNLRLVFSIAKTFQNQGLELEDLIQEGNIGLLTAISKFDYHKGYKFSTYATHWIKSSIRMSIVWKARSIRLPMSQYIKLSKFNNSLNEVYAQNGVDVSLKEVASSLNMSERKVEGFLALNNPLVNIEKVNDIASPEDAIKEMEDRFLTKDIQKSIQKLLLEAPISEKQREIIKLNFGIGYDEPYSLVEIAKMYNISSERIRQIIKNALNLIRCYSASNTLAVCSPHPMRSLENKEKLIKAMIPKTTPITKKSKTIYERYPEKSREIVNAAIKLLPVQYKSVFFKRYGDDLTVPQKSYLNNKEKRIFERRILPFLDDLLGKERKKKISSKALVKEKV